jgi:putative ABC transport system permease protein
MWSIAFKTLLADRGKFCTALVGVVFAFVLANVQGGLYLGLIRKAALLVDQGGVQIWVGHRHMHNVDFPKQIPVRWIDRVKTIPGVVRAEPFAIGFAMMSLPSGRFEEVQIVGVDNVSFLGSATSMSVGTVLELRQPDGIIIDEMEQEKFEYPQIGDQREINGKRAIVVAKCKGVVGFLIAPYVFTTLDRAAEYRGHDSNYCSYYLIQTAEGADLAQICKQIKQRIPELDAFTSDRYRDISVDYWMKRTGIGVSFGGATVLGLFIGLVMVAQTLYALVLDRIEEFATLKAIGSPEFRIYGILFLQATIMAVFGILIGIGLVRLITVFGSTPKAPIVVPVWLTCGTSVLVFMICLLSAILPFLKVRRVDPVMVLQS